MRRVLLLLLFFLAASPARAAELTGRVRDAESGAALGFVNVQARGLSPEIAELTRGTLGAGDGTYRLTGLTPGRWLIRFSRIGHEVLEDSVLVTEERTATLDVALVARALLGKGVLVEAERYAEIRDIQTGFVTLDPEVLADLPGVVEADPVRVLELLPGVQTASDYSSGLYVRGGGPDQTLVLLDQVPVYNPTHAFGFFSTFNADALQDVSLYKGAYPARYGGRLGAVLDVRTRDGSTKEFTGGAGISLIAAHATGGGPVGGGSWTASLRRTYLEPILSLVRRSVEDIPSYYFYDGNARLTLPLAGGRLTCTGYGGRDDLQLDIDADNTLQLRWGNTLGSASWGRNFGERGYVRLQGSWSEYRSESSILALTTPIDFSNHIRDAELRADASRVGGKHKLSAGLGASLYDVRYEQTFNSESQIDYHKTPSELAAFIEDEWRARASTEIQTGLRLGLIEGGRVLWEPRLAVSQQLDPRVKAKFGAGMYHQYLQLVSTEALSAADFYVPLDETVPPGQSWQSVLGVEYQPGDAWRTSLETYYSGLGDLITLNNDLPAGVQVNNAADFFYAGGEGWASGLEFFVEKRRGKVTGWFGYGLGWTRRTFSQLNGGEPFAPKYDRRHDINLVAQMRHGKWKFGSNFVYATGQAFTPAAARYAVRNPATGGYSSDPQLIPGTRNSARLLPYNRLDLSAGRDFSLFGLPAEWFVQVFNVYSRRNEWFVQYDTSGDVVEATVVPMLPVIPSLGLNFQF